VDELRLIRHAAVLAKHRNFARAAEALHLTQPSLSRGIAALERALGVRLFDRTRNGAFPTVFGRLLLERGDTVLRSVATLHRELQLLAGLETGSLVIGTGPFPGEISVATAIARLLRRHPRLAIDCRTAEADQVLDDVLAERADVGVARVTGIEDHERLVVETLPPLRAYLACRPGHPMTSELQPSFARALDFPLATNVLRGAPAAAAARRDGTLVAHEAGTADFVPQVIVNSPAIARLIARESDALVLGTARQLADDVAAGHLVRLDIDAPVLRTVHGVFHLRDRTLAPAAQAFIDILRLVEREIRQAETAGCSATVKTTREVTG
jgi:DNA-binding transcriptional LysR family regulator